MLQISDELQLLLRGVNRYLSIFTGSATRHCPAARVEGATLIRSRSVSRPPAQLPQPAVHTCCPPPSCPALLILAIDVWLRAWLEERQMGKQMTSLGSNWIITAQNVAKSAQTAR